MQATASKTQKKIDLLKTLIDHPRTGENERNAARPWGPAAPLGGRTPGATGTEQEDPMPDLTATLVINITGSYCDHCRKETLPQATRHTDISGWTPRPGAGCGALFIDMRSDYVNVTELDLKRVRPDLPIYGKETGA